MNYSRHSRLVSHLLLQLHVLVNISSIFCVAFVAKSTTTISNHDVLSSSSSLPNKVFLTTRQTKTHLFNGKIPSSSSFQSEEAQELLEKARQLREEIKQREQEKESLLSSKVNGSISREATTPNDRKGATATTTADTTASKWNVPATQQGVNDIGNTDNIGYRLYVNIGREDGTWMEPRWGASGKRIEFTLDVQLTKEVEPKSSIKRNYMVQDNMAGQSSDIYQVRTAKAARLRNGFDQMNCINLSDMDGNSGGDNATIEDVSSGGGEGGAYRIDVDRSGGGGALGGIIGARRSAATATMRFYIPVEGTPEQGSSYG